MTENKRFENKYTANYMNNKIVSPHNPKGESLNEQMIVELNKLSDAIKKRRIKDEKLKSVNIEYEDAFARLEQRNKRLEEKIQRERNSFTTTQERIRKEAENKIKELSEKNELLKKSVKRQQDSNNECAKLIKEQQKEIEQLKQRINSRLHFYRELYESTNDKFVERVIEDLEDILKR